MPKQQAPFDVESKVVLITGGTRGLGRAMAKGLAAAGARVIVTGRKPADCEAAAKELSEESAGSVLGIACHMGDWAQIDALVERVYESEGRIDVLVNNAGINPTVMPVADMTSEYWDKVQGVNLKGPMHLAGLVAPRMGQQGGGSIVNVITVGAYIGGIGMAAYASSKAGLRSLTKIMAQEWAPLGVRVNSLAPGSFMTDMMRGAAEMPGFLDGARDFSLQKRIAEPEEIVGTILYLASDASAFMTGTNVMLSGGMEL